MKKVDVRDMITRIILIICLAVGVFAVYYISASAMDTTTGYRYPKDFEKALKNYPDLDKITDKTYAIPGLANTDVHGSDCDAMTPQGVCTTKNYILVTAYCDIDNYRRNLHEDVDDGDNEEKIEQERGHHRHNSVIYVLDKENGKYLKTLVLKGDRSHVGGIAYDGEYVWVARSSSVASENYLGIISEDRIDKAVKSSQDSVYIYYDNDHIKTDVRTSFVSYYDNKIWVGVFEPHEIDHGSFVGYEIKGNSPSTYTLKKVVDLPITTKANGAAFFTVDGVPALVANESDGRDLDSKMHIYSLKLDGKEPVDVTGTTKDLKLPPMAETIWVDGDKFYMVFESASTSYSGVSGDKCPYPIGRVIVGDVADLS